MSTILPDDLPTMGRETRRGLTPAEKFAQEMNAFAAMCVRIGVMASLLAPILIISMLVIDIPVRFFNELFSPLTGLKPTQWLTWGGIVVSLIPLVSILFARRYGGEETSRAIIAAWFVLALFILFELSLLSPIIEEGDFPSTRFMVALVASSMTGQLVTVSFYDVLRGGAPWWRAPLYAALAGFFVTILIYFPLAYWQTGLSWSLWLIGDMMVKTLFAVGFLPIYFVLRKRIKPRRGFGAV